MRNRMVAISVLLLVAAAVPASAQTLERCADGAKQAVGKVTARRGGTSSVSTGFLYGETRYLVTALHAVAGADAIEVTFLGEPQAFASGRIVRALTRCDLALVELDPPPARTPLGTDSVRPAAGQRMVIVGFPLNVPRHRGEYVQATATDPVARLDQGVPPDVAQKLRGQNVLDITQEVVHLQAPLKPGHSGAPILDDGCRLVGVGNGGVNQGPGLWSWAIPAQNLADLLASNDAVPDFAGGETQLFSNDVVTGEFTPEVVAQDDALGDDDLEDWLAWLDEEGEDDEPIHGLLVKTGTRSLADIQWSLDVWSGDDPMGLQAILTEFATYGVAFPPDELMFDVYYEEATGASVVLPAGAVLRADGTGRFEARLAGDRIRLLLATYLGQDPQWASTAFEQQINAEYLPLGVQFMLDPTYTYLDAYGQPAPFVRWDGTMFTRKSYQIVVPDMWGGAELAGYVFENLSAFEQSTLAAVAIAEVAVPELLHDRAFLKAWMQSVLGVHMSSLAAG